MSFRNSFSSFALFCSLTGCLFAALISSNGTLVPLLHALPGSTLCRRAHVSFLPRKVWLKARLAKSHCTKQRFADTAQAFARARSCQLRFHKLRQSVDVLVSNAGYFQPQWEIQSILWAWQWLVYTQLWMHISYSCPTASPKACIILIQIGNMQVGKLAKLSDHLNIPKYQVAQTSWACSHYAPLPLIVIGHLHHNCYLKEILRIGVITHFGAQCLNLHAIRYQ